MGAVARRLGPSFRALLFGRGGGAVCELPGGSVNVRQWERLPGGSVRPSGPCCLGVAEAPFVSLDGWKRASLGAVARRLGPSFRALLFCCGEGAVCEP